MNLQIMVLVAMLFITGMGGMLSYLERNIKIFWATILIQLPLAATVPFLSH